ncbi:hypothetical protein QMM42_17840 [Leptospira santarosai]|uniref:Uncharacterized protein n=1 Tax=Leptospira santarosai serovar Arenal str. MAVJ 401 TaxID=1049976 RepID=M6JS79_9LEPT|nr:hypothetical protein [Leptospira santarosai]EMN22405.1 hypothetical protein LEP1GSC063_3211 [Leptospira santarosai serovar Arenal str. MAVJ 401]MDI7188033.1 hypothetical protein [Leptospira santarosai]MDI7200089.1 hypothetical protein [Leptospira santarosai]MDI7230454.1 hypothetical protein [Leptospira santarosai]
MKKLKVLSCILSIITSPALYSDTKEVEYEVKKDIGEIVRGIYEIAPGVYDVGGSRSRQDHLNQLKVFNKEILPDVLKFRDAYLTGDLEGLLGSLSDEYYDKLKVNYNSRKKKGEALIKSRKEMREIYKREVLTCTEDKDLGFGLCDFLKNRENAIKNRVKIIISTYGSTDPKYKIGGLAVAFVELDGNNPDHPYSKEFQFVREKGKLQIVDTLYPDRPDIELCVFCYYESGEESVRRIFNSIKQANELK